MNSQVECPVCDGTDYVLRQGQYYCIMCNTQSQELGMETVMDEETIPMELQGKNRSKITIGKKGSKNKKKSLQDGTRWSTAEGFSFILRGWIDQLKCHGIDVEVAVIQLWTLYLRKLNLAFEKRGMENKMSLDNLRLRELWNMIGAPPVLLSTCTLRASAKRRLSVVEGDVVDSDEEIVPRAEEEDSIDERKRRSKKRKHFFKSVSNADSGSEMDPKSPSSSNVASKSGDASSEAESHDDFQEDPSFYTTILERCNKRNVRYSATTLTLGRVLELFTLAVISLPLLTIDISDMIRFFKHEILSWTSTADFIPKSFTHSRSEIFHVFSGDDNGYKFDAKIMAKNISKLACFLYDAPPGTPSKCLFLAYTSRKILKTNEKYNTFEIVLRRYLHDLSLPNVLCDEMMRCFKKIHLTNIAAYLVPYSESSKYPFPLVSKRILALILLTLKFYCGFDDQFEVYMSSNGKRIASLDNLPENHFFDPVKWLRLSKLRLDYMMSTSFCMREQYEKLGHVGTMDLTVPAVLSKLEADSKRFKYMADSKPDKKFAELTRIMSELCVNTKPSEYSSFSFEPLQDKTQKLLSSGHLDPQVKKSLQSLLSMSDASVSLCYETMTKNNPVIEALEKNKKSELKLKRVKLKKNWVSSPFHLGINSSGLINLKVHRIHMDKLMKGGKLRKSNYRVPQLKNESKHLYNVVNKTYWFAHHLDSDKKLLGHKYLYKKSQSEHLTDAFLNLLPSNFSWLLKYFSCYAYLCPIELMQELNNLEKYILLLDKEFFGSLKTMNPTSLKWKGKTVTINPGRNSKRKSASKGN